MNWKCFSKGTVGVLAVLIFWVFLGLAYGAEPIKIGGSLSRTGKYAWIGERMYEGYNTWANFINKKGYSPGLEKYGQAGSGLIDGRPVKIIIYDDQSDPSVTIKLYQRLITQDKVDLILGPYSSGLTKAITPIIEKAQIPTVATVASDPEIWTGKKLKWMVEGMCTMQQYSEGMAKMAKRFAIKTAAIIFDDSASPMVLAKTFQKQLEEQGIKVVLFEAYPHGITDWAPPLSKAWALKPELIGIGGYEQDAIGLTKAAQAIKAAPKLFYWTVGADSNHFVESVGNAANSIITSMSWDTSADIPGNLEFMKTFSELYSIPINKIAGHSAAGFMGGQLLEIAVKSAGSLDPKAVRDKLFAMEAQTILGAYKVKPLSSDDSGLQIAHQMWVIQWQKKKPGYKSSVYKAEVGDYVREVIYPENIKTADVLLFPGWQ